MKITETKDGAIIEVFVKPNSQKFEVTVEDNEIIVRCTEEPLKGKVNKELLKSLSKLFHTNVELVSGVTSRQKKLLIKEKTKNEVENVLALQSA
jgi:uncharacterized protein (TIGR00251 family)